MLILQAAALTACLFTIPVNILRQEFYLVHYLIMNFTKNLLVEFSYWAALTEQSFPMSCCAKSFRQAGT